MKPLLQCIQGSAIASIAVFGVPPNTFSQRGKGRRETHRPAIGTIALPKTSNHET
jgi:hypothetical protein